MLERDRSVRQIDNGNAFDAKARRHQPSAISGLDLHALRMEAPLGDILVTGGDLCILGNDGIETDSFNAIGGEVKPRTVLRLVGETSRVDKKAGLGFVVPLCA